MIEEIGRHGGRRGDGFSLSAFIRNLEPDDIRNVCKNLLSSRDTRGLEEVATYFKNFSQNDLRCFILRTDVDNVRGRATTF